MTKAEIKKLVKSLAQSQGLYGRLLRDIEQSGNEEKIWEQLEKQNFKDGVEFVLFIEGGL